MKVWQSLLGTWRCESVSSSSSRCDSVMIVFLFFKHLLLKGGYRLVAWLVVVFAILCL